MTADPTPDTDVCRIYENGSVAHRYGCQFGDDCPATNDPRVLAANTRAKRLPDDADPTAECEACAIRYGQFTVEIDPVRDDPTNYECGPGRPCPERAHDHWPSDDTPAPTALWTVDRDGDAGTLWWVFGAGEAMEPWDALDATDPLNDQFSPAYDALVALVRRAGFREREAERARAEAAEAEVRALRELLREIASDDRAIAGLSTEHYERLLAATADPTPQTEESGE